MKLKKLGEAGLIERLARNFNPELRDLFDELRKRNGQSLTVPVRGAND